MFLTESYNSRVPADVTYGMQIVSEAENTWHKLEMGMIKLEHAAIMNENTRLLNEGADDFFNKAKNLFINIGKKFMLFIDAVIRKWTEIQASLMSKLVNEKKIKEKIAKNGGNKSIQIDSGAVKGAKDIIRWGSNIANKLANGEISSIYDNGPGNIDINKYEKKMETMTAAEVQTILDFIKRDRPQAIKILKDIKNAYQKSMKKAIKACDDKKSDEVKALKSELTNGKRSINDYILAINKATTQAIKGLNALASKSDKAQDRYDNSQKKYNEREDKYNKKVEKWRTKAESAGILDNYMD